MDDVTKVLLAITTIGLIATIVVSQARASGAVDVIQSITSGTPGVKGSGFAGMLNAAEGNG